MKSRLRQGMSSPAYNVVEAKEQYRSAHRRAVTITLSDATLQDFIDNHHAALRALRSNRSEAP